MSKSSSAKKRSAAAPKSVAKQRSRAPKPRTFADELATDTFLDELPMGTFGEEAYDEAIARAGYAGSRSPRQLLTVVFRLTMTQPASFQSLAGSPSSAPRTDHITLHGVDRFYAAGKKLRGVVRRVISEALRDQNVCHDRETRHGRPQCGKCFVCRVFGHMMVGANSRITFSDLISDQEYRPVVYGSINTTSGNPFIRKLDMVPPFTTFWGLFELRYPTKVEVATLLAALSIAGTRGIGAQTTNYGRFRADIVGILGGYILNLGGVMPLVETAAKGLEPDDALKAVIAQLPYEPPALIGEKAREAAFKIQALSPLSPLYGETF